MNKEIIKSEILSLLEAINEQFGVVKDQQEKIPQIEFDIMLENLRKLYDNLLRLQRLEDKIQATVKIEPRPEKIPDIPVSVQVDKAPAKKMPASTGPDLFEAEEPAFSIKLKEAREKSLGPKIPSSKIDNLKSIISINEKFLFINELFDGNLREYNEAIDTLNEFTDLNLASDYLDSMRKKNFWDTGSQAFMKLTELIQRKF